MQSKSEDNGSLWVKIGGEGYQTRVVDGILQIKSDSAMIGYLNVKSPFTEDGWFITGDSLDVMVYGEKHPFTGSIVCAKVFLEECVNKAAYIKNKNISQAKTGII